MRLPFVEKGCRHSKLFEGCPRAVLLYGREPLQSPEFQAEVGPHMEDIRRIQYSEKQRSEGGSTAADASLHCAGARVEDYAKSEENPLQLATARKPETPPAAASTHTPPSSSSLLYAGEARVPPCSAVPWSPRVLSKQKPLRRRPLNDGDFFEILIIGTSSLEQQRILRDSQKRRVKFVPRVRRSTNKLDSCGRAETVRQRRSPLGAKNTYTVRQPAGDFPRTSLPTTPNGMHKAELTWMASESAEQRHSV